MTEPKRIFQPEHVHELLRGWLLHAHKGRDRHDFAARRFERSRYFLGIPTVILSTAVGTSVFAALGAQRSATVQIIVALLSVAAAVLAALQTLLDYPTRADRHRATGAKYKSVIRQLEQVLSALPGTVPPEDWIEQLRTRLDALEEDAPVVAPGIYATIEKRFQNVGVVKEALALYST